MTKLMEDKLVAEFFAGLRPDIARFVAVRNPRYLVEAEKFARLEASAARAQATSQDIQACYAVSARPLLTSEGQRWGRGNVKTACKEIICFSCNQQGHFAREGARRRQSCFTAANLHI